MEIGSPVTRQHAARLSARKRWKFDILDLFIALFCLAGVTMFTYPTAAKWVSQYNQSNILFDQAKADALSGKNDSRAMLAAAQAYNQALRAHAVLPSGANIAQGSDAEVESFDYWTLLNSDPTGIMARLQIRSIDLDLPVYHGTSDEVLLKGIGHLQGTALPVGGVGTRSVLTGHRGLANATMFTNLDRVKKGDTFSVEVLGEVLTYEVVESKVVQPNDTEEIRAVPDRDLMTLVTCTPLGINSHRILVTGERVYPTPQEDIDAAGLRPTIPHFPWWFVFYATAVLAIGLWYWRSGKSTRRLAKGDSRRQKTEL